MYYFNIVVNLHGIKFTINNHYFKVHSKSEEKVKYEVLFEIESIEEYFPCNNNLDFNLLVDVNKLESVKNQNFKIHLKNFNLDTNVDYFKIQKISLKDIETQNKLTENLNEKIYKLDLNTLKKLYIKKLETAKEEELKVLKEQELNDLFLVEESDKKPVIEIPTKIKYFESKFKINIEHYYKYIVFKRFIEESS